MLSVFLSRITSNLHLFDEKKTSVSSINLPFFCIVNELLRVTHSQASICFFIREFMILLMHQLDSLPVNIFHGK